MDMYRDNILDHYKHPRNFGKLSHPHASAQEYNATCGDRIVMDVIFKGNKVEEIKFHGEGCAISQASASMLTEKVKAKTKKEVMRLTTDDIVSMLGTTLTPSRTKCGVLPLEVLQKAISQVVQ